MFVNFINNNVNYYFVFYEWINNKSMVVNNCLKNKNNYISKNK